MSKILPPPAIRLRGVRHNNLKNLDLDLPLGKLIVVTGLSGSGKSSLAFDTLFAEGQRRYVETFSPYARQFFDRMDKPQVDRIEGIPPAIAIEQRNAVRSTRSTVGTMTELCDYMKLLWPHLAELHCRKCGQIVREEPPRVVWERVTAESAARAGDSSRAAAAEVLVTFELPLSEKLSLEESLALIAKQGYQRLLLGGDIVRLEEAHSRLTDHASRPHSLTVLQDRVKLAVSRRARFVEACEQGYHFGKGRLTVHFIEAGGGAPLPAPLHFSAGRHCARCDLEYREPSPALFSYNHPIGACPACKGFGRIITIDYDRAIPDRTRTLAQGAVRPWQSGTGAESQADLMKFCKASGIPVHVPFAQLPQKIQDWVIEGDVGYGKDAQHQWPRAWYGVKGYFRWLESKAYKMHVRVLLSRYRAYSPCPECRGRRLQPEALLYQVQLPEESRSTPDLPRQISLADFYALPVDAALPVIDSLSARLRPGKGDPLELALQEVRARLGFLAEVGLGYLTLDRSTRTLSGGETERVSLTTCLGTRLVNTLYVLDEPSVGLHPRDTARLVGVLEKLRDLGNTVVVVEHEPAVMRAADHLVDLGPGRGDAGGQIVFQGSFPELQRSKISLTGQYLSGARTAEVSHRRPVEAGPVSPSHALHEAAAPYGGKSGKARPVLKISNAARHNLKNLTVEIPLGRFVCLTGVSGSGKTTLVRDVLLPALEAHFKSEISNPKSNQASDRLDADGAASADDPESEAKSVMGNPPSALAGQEHLNRVVLVDQSSIGKTPRSNPVVYIGAFEGLRNLFAQTEPARQRGLNASAFSFNAAAGQCERCRGAGFEKIEMQFLSDVFVRCPDCDGRRYRAHVLEIKLPVAAVAKIVPPESAAARSRLPPPIAGAWSIADFLEATADDAISALAPYADTTAGRQVLGGLRLLQDVGLGYLRLGQPINTLSGGESQRLKMVSHLAESAASAGPRDGDVEEDGSKARFRDPSLRQATLFLFDEPTTGLHFDDVRVLLKVLQRLVEAGHSLVVIEHNLDVIRSADWIIDLGPEAGEGGGEIVAQGTPEDVANCERSHTGQFLREGRPGAAAARLRGGFEVGQRAEQEAGVSPDLERRHPVRIVPRKFGEAPASDTSRGRTLRPPTGMADSVITVHGAREHNLKNISLTIPRGQFVVVTGVSGSGKSTLAFDLLFNEGQRRFLESMNAYVRQFAEQMARPEVDLITGLPPTVSIEQRTSRGGGKSTVATVTEVYHFFRLLFARLGLQHCPDCHVAVEAQTRDQVARHLRSEAQRRGDLILLAPVVRHRKGFHSDIAQWAAQHGYAQVRADGRLYDSSEPFRLDRFQEHDVEIVVGVLEGKQAKARPPLRAGPGDGPTVQQLVDETLKLGRGTLSALDDRGTVTIHSTERACPKCQRSFAPLDPKMFSYNSAQGWCPECRGFGELFYLPDTDRGARADAIEESWWSWQEGEREACPSCAGARLNPVSRAVRLHLAPGPRRAARPDLGIDDLSALPVAGALALFRTLKFTGRAAQIARDILPEILERLKFLDAVGLGYLQLGRGVTTLSGGESQRIRLAAQLGSNLSGVLYVLDEPTIGLHARDNVQLLAALTALQARGNSLVVVEHDEETMRRADYIVDLGPGAGVHGGRVVAAGTLAELMRHEDSVTGRCLRAQAERKFPARAGGRRPVGGRAGTRGKAGTPGAWLTLRGAAVHNLKNLTVEFPLGRLIVVTGVSGSGKSTLVRECLLPALAATLRGKRRGAPRPATPARKRAAASSGLSGHEAIGAVYEVDQSPIGRTPRSTPATYVGFFDDIRQLFAQVPEARLRGYTASRFSFNSVQGRCPTCEGAGTIKLEMNFLPPAFVKCETCGGTRFDRETLDIEYGGRNIAQVLGLSVEEAIESFASVPRIKRPLEALRDTGLHYLSLGQISPTLSGGEAQRVKLVTHLLTGLKAPDRFERAPQRNLFLLEEPTIGLHTSDVARLLEVLQRLVEAGHTVIVIEHNLELIAEADWVIDLGPEGGAGGGTVVAVGTPEAVAACRGSHTGQFLRPLLTRNAADVARIPGVRFKN